MKRATIDGPLHPVHVKFVTDRTLRKHWPKEQAGGVFDPAKNTIYLSKDYQNEELRLHALVHELVHMIDAQCLNLDDEGRADIIAAWLIKFFNISSVEELLEKGKA